MRKLYDRLLKIMLFAVVGFVFASCGGGSDSQQDVSPPIGTTTSAAISSKQTGAVYSLDIYLPASYATSSRTYPVIYATDGDASYPPLGRFQNFRAILQKRHTDAILVGIGGAARRNTDYVLPGAVAYHNFITQELIPFIEARYRADPKRRVLSGLSLGGSFVVTSLFIEAPDSPLFSHYISAEGSFWQSSFLEQENQISATFGDKKMPITLILAAGAQIPSTNSQAVSALYQRLKDRNYSGLVLVKTDFATEHVATDNPSFEDAVSKFFE